MKKVFIILLMLIVAFTITGCDEVQSATKTDQTQTIEIGNKLSQNQPTPTDINYSIERHNLIKRAYWVNGQRSKALAIPNPIADMPLGYVILFTDNGSVVGRFVVDGKVSSLNSYLTADSEYYELNYGGSYQRENKWLPDVDGSYGENDNGIFFFTTDGKYIEWTGTYLYSDIPFEVSNPILTVKGE